MYNYSLPTTMAYPLLRFTYITVQLQHRVKVAARLCMICRLCPLQTSSHDHKKHDNGTVYV